MTPAAQTSEPQTEAGRALDSAGGWYDEVGTYVRCTDLTSAIRNIEAEAQRLTVERLELAEWEQVQLDAIRYRSQQAYIGVGPERLASIDVAWLLDRLDRALAREETGE